MSVIDEVSDRKLKNYSYILEPETFIQKKLTSIEEAVAFEKAAVCMEEC